MESYLGVKMVQAKKHPIDEREGYMVVYEDGHKSWCLREAFEKAYKPINALSFGFALEALKKGLYVAREGWNGKGMYLGLCEGGGFRDGYRTQDFIYMKTVSNTVVPWQASQADMLAHDWKTVERS